MYAFDKSFQSGSIILHAGQNYEMIANHLNLYNTRHNRATRENMINYPNVEYKTEPRTTQNKWGLVLLAIFLLSVVYAATNRILYGDSVWVLAPVGIMIFICIPGILILEKVFPEIPKIKPDK